MCACIFFSFFFFLIFLTFSFSIFEGQMGFKVCVEIYWLGVYIEGNGGELLFLGNDKDSTKSLFIHNISLKQIGRFQGL